MCQASFNVMVSPHSFARILKGIATGLFLSGKGKPCAISFRPVGCLRQIPVPVALHELTKTLTEDVMQNLKVSFNAAARRKCRLAEIDYLQSLLWTLTLQLIEEQNRLRREISDPAPAAEAGVKPLRGCHCGTAGAANAFSMCGN